jgi:hypothetical protein
MPRILGFDPSLPFEQLERRSKHRSNERRVEARLERMGFVAGILLATLTPQWGKEVSNDE